MAKPDERFDMIKTTTCVVDGCDSGGKMRKQMCGKHYARSRNGLPLIAVKAPERKCDIEGCDRRHRNHGYCEVHWDRVRRHGSPDLLGPQSLAKHPQWAGDDVTYSAWHRRIRVIRGSAKLHQCSECAQQAVDWAYDGLGGPRERRETGTGYPYVVDLDHYEPLCRSCHSRRDKSTGRRRDR